MTDAYGIELVTGEAPGLPLHDWGSLLVAVFRGLFNTNLAQDAFFPLLAQYGHVAFAQKNNQIRHTPA